MEHKKMDSDSSHPSGDDSVARVHPFVTQRAPADWPVGDYQCLCVACGQFYIGPKRSACCELCKRPAAATGATA